MDNAWETTIGTDRELTWLRDRVRELESRLEAQQARGAVERQCCLQVEAMNEGAATLSSAGVVLSANRRLAQMLDVTPRELLGRPIGHFVSPQDASTIEALLSQALSIPVAAEVWLSRLAGPPLAAYFSLSPIQRTTEPRICLVATDLSLRRRNEEIMASEALARSVIEQSAQAIFVCDCSGIVIRASHVADSILDRAVLLERFDALFPLRAEGDRRGIAVRALSGESLSGVEGSLASGDATWTGTRNFLISAGPLVGPGNEVRGCVISLTEVTGQRRQERMGFAIREVARLEMQFRQSQKMEALGRIAGGVAHDFNNLLTVISGRTELVLQGGSLSEADREELRQVAEASSRATGLTRRMLAFSRSQPLEPRVVDLNALIGGLEGMLRRLIGEDIRLEVRPSPALGRVKADPGQIEQVLLNLVVNARDAMPRGGQLTMTTTDVTLDDAPDHAGEGRRQAVITVEDSGCGMDEATLSRAFEPFFTTKQTGTGLGLSTVYGIVAQSGGHVWAESEVALGTKFHVRLPVVDEPLAPCAPPPDAPPLGRHETVLLVEDNELVRSFLFETLRCLDYEVLAAANGDDALGLFQCHAGSVDLLLTDVVMPGLAGTDLVRLARELRPGVRALCMSGYTEGSVYRERLLEGNLAFIQKPFSAEELGARLRQVLDAPPDGPGVGGMGSSA